MNLRLDYNNMMSEAVGSEGLDESVFAENAAFIEKAYKTVMDGRGKGWQEWCDLPYVGNDYLDEMISYCDGIRRKAESFVVFGIGGSALGRPLRSQHLGALGAQQRRRAAGALPSQVHGRRSPFARYSPLSVAERERFMRALYLPKFSFAFLC